MENAGGSRLDPHRRRPSSRSIGAGLLLQVVLVVVFGVRLAATHPTSAAVVAALAYGSPLVLLWWVVGRWFSLVLLVDATPFVSAVVARNLGLDPQLALVATFAVIFPAVVVGILAHRMDRSCSAAMTRVDPGSFVLPAPIARDLVTAGFRDRPDLVYGLDGVKAAVGVFAHRTEPIYADVFVPRSSSRARPIVGLVTLLSGNRSLHTGTQGHFAAGPGRLRQEFPRTALDERTRRHVAALAWLSAHGITALPADPASHPVLIETVMDDTAACFRAHPLRTMARAIVLSVRRRSLDEGPIQDRAGILHGLEAVSAGF